MASYFISVLVTLGEQNGFSHFCAKLVAKAAEFFGEAEEFRC